MVYKIFFIPYTGDSAAEEELNLFLRSHRIVDVKNYFVENQGGSGICFSVEYSETESSAISNSYGKGSGKGVDYKDIRNILVICHVTLKLPIDLVQAVMHGQHQLTAENRKLFPLQPSAGGV